MDVAEEKEEMRRKEGRRRGERTNGRERVEEVLLSSRRKFSVARQTREREIMGERESDREREREIPEGERRREGGFGR